jgi:uncharacterized phosphosugar-binding protein
VVIDKYFSGIKNILDRIEKEQGESILEASRAIANCIIGGGMCHFFGSGHSVIPVLDAFPRYGSFLGLNPLMDARLMWFSATGTGSAPGLLNIERKEGYVEDGFLRFQPIKTGDTMVVYSHGGLNAAPVEAALYGKKVGATVIAITSLSNQNIAKATHSSGKKLSDIADILIDNCVPPEDAIITLPGRKEKVGASSTMAVVGITMALVSQSAEFLTQKGHALKVFVSPNVEGFGVDYNLTIFDDHCQLIASHGKK